MKESLPSQINIGATEFFYPDKELSLKSGRKPLITSDIWLDAVKKLHTMKDSEIAKELGVSRQTIWRFRSNPKNIDVINEGIEFLKKLSKTGYYKELDNWDIFKNIHIVKEWKNLMENRRLKRKTINGWLKGLWHLCKLLKRHPAKLTIMEASKINKEIREFYYNGDLDQIPRGLNYQSCRESIRGFFMSVHNVSAQHLTNMGITKENLPSFGKYSKMNIPREIRHRFEETIKKYCDNENEYWDTLNLCVIAYATATRATALSEVELNHAIIFNEKEWVFEIVDKGNIKWNKIVVGHLLEKLRHGLSKRFKIPLDDLERELPKVTNQLFPLAYNDINKMRGIIKNSLIDAGLRYREFPPIHIWRHCFAQDALRASNWNYELVASIGGWKSTKILKEVYGEIGLDTKINGIKKLMGIKEKDEGNFELRW